MQVGLRHSSISRIFSGSVAMPAGVTTCPRYKTLFWNNLHFFGFNLRFACLSLRNTSCNLLNSSSRLSHRQGIRVAFPTAIQTLCFPSVFQKCWRHCTTQRASPFTDTVLQVRQTLLSLWLSRPTPSANTRMQDQA